MHPMAELKLADQIIYTCITLLNIRRTIHFWDLERRRVTSTIPKAPTNMPWAEDMCWVGKNTLAVASAHKEGVPMPHQLMLVHVDKAKPTSPVTWTIQSLDQKPHDASKGGILCLTGMTEDRSGISLATAGMDKQIVSLTDL